MNMITRLLAPAAAIVAFAAPAMAEKIPLSDISAYLNSLQTAEAKFTQINSDGTVSTGKLYIKRPGRMRFEYDPPEKALVLASSGSVAVFDPKSHGGPSVYPLSKTPLGIILQKDVDLDRANMVTGHIEQGPGTMVRAQDPEHPEYGSIDLIFTNNPVELRQWVVHDDSGNTTTVSLGDLETGMSLNNGLFRVENETSNPQNER